VPTYQYACTACGHALEAVQSFSDEPLTVCPECEGKLRKLFSSVGIVFKGSGFYRNDSRGDKGGEKTGTSTTTSTPAATPATAPAQSSAPSTTSSAPAPAAS
jgi:putative FmdB family regulatory protein